MNMGYVRNVSVSAFTSLAFVALLLGTPSSSSAAQSSAPARVGVALPAGFHGTDLVITSVRSHGNACTTTQDGPLYSGGCQAGRFQQGAGQNVFQLIGDATGSKSVARITIWNFQPRARRVTLKGAATTRAYKVGYFAGSEDITRAVTSGTYRTPRIKPGTARGIRMVITTRRFVRNGKDTGFLVRAKATAVTASSGEIAEIPGDLVTDYVRSFPYDALPVILPPPA